MAVDTLDTLELVFEAACLEARRKFGMKLSREEFARLGILNGALADDGRRRFRRLDVDCEGTVAHNAGHIVGRLVDLSPGGCLLESMQSIPEGTAVRLSVECVGTRRIFDGVVCRRQEGQKKLIALRFTAVPMELCIAEPELAEAG